ncbi:MAG: arginine--tRNA ligase, partial [Verrucomicrobiia bacterium]
MKLIPELLKEALKEALRCTGLPAEPEPVVSPTNDERFGDYQSNVAMTLAKRLKANPRELAQRVISALSIETLASVDLAGAGFINFRLQTRALADRVLALQSDPRLGVAIVPEPRRIVLDFSSPNIAKPMHIGHIRSTVLGDCLARIARFLGHTVITDNHVGDWGTQFGKVIYGWKTELDRKALEEDAVGEMVRLYRTINAAATADPVVEEACRAELVKLQQGDEENLSIWRECIALSRGEFEEIYRILDVTFDHWLGESFYNDRLAPLVARLEREGIAQESEGALCVFFPEDAALADKPCLVRKRDGGFLYATTDLATIDFRVEEWKADAIWYVVGAPQQLHLAQVFATARRIGHTVELHHIAFGSILGEDRKLMKTRSGENVAD